MKIYLNILILFAVSIAVSFVPDYFRDFFGDELCNGHLLNLETGKEEYFYHKGDRHYEVVYHWGYRHWLLFTCGLSLFTVQLISIIVELNKKHE